jgi:glycosyltransferase involved in cell wall biosynthesis
MLSIILPYWKRPEVTATTLGLYHKHYYQKLHFEVVLVDDGSDDLMNCWYTEYPWLKIVKLPKKDNPKNPCVPINRGVENSIGDVIVLSGPDIQHTVPVLFEMKAELDRRGPNGYVLAACWYEDDKRWHCHSSITANGYHEQIKQPLGSGYHFCAMLNRTLWDKAGGFDEEYREGAYFDDPDWVNRVHRAGAEFKIRDDLVVQHVRTGASCSWGDGYNVNRKLFMEKWP